MMYRLAIYATLITTIVFGKSYTIDNVEIQSTIGKDGIVQSQRREHLLLKVVLRMHIKLLIRKILKKYLIFRYQKMDVTI